jgi:hypothetical protein
MGRYAIEMALDLARMPALARNSVEPPIPQNIAELMSIAAESPGACREAAAATGETVPAVIDAARFYLQHALFRPDADSYRILGLRPGASRATARSHMRLLMQWLHPDRNGDLEAVYAERVLKAWREVSTAGKSGKPDHVRAARKPNGGPGVRLPWIKRPHKQRPAGFWRSVASWVLPSSLVIVFLLLSAIYYWGVDQTVAMIRVR